MSVNTNLRAILVVGMIAAAGASLYVLRSKGDATQESTHLSQQEQPVSSNGPQFPPLEASPEDAALRAPASVALAYAMLNKGSSMKSTLEHIVGPRGSITSPELASLAGTADAACADVRENAGHYLSATQLEDPTRAWASKRLVEICHEFDLTEYSFDFPKEGLSKGLDVMSDSQLINASLAALRSEKSTSELYTAGQILLEKDKATLLGILPNGGRGYGDPEILKSWALAGTLITCSEAGGCGPNAVQTAAFCANTGCEPGSDFAQVLRQRLPENEYRAVNAFYSWMSSQRRI